MIAPRWQFAGSRIKNGEGCLCSVFYSGGGSRPVDDPGTLLGGLFKSAILQYLRKNGEIQMDPQNEVLLSLTVLLTGIVVVFAMLIFLTIIIKIYGTVIYNTVKKRTKAPAPKQAPAPAPVPQAAPIAVEDGISGEVVAAIAAAVYMTYGVSASSIRSVKRAAANPRSLWGEAGRLENTRPF